VIAGVLLLLGVGGAVGARPLAFAILHSKTAHRFPSVQWISGQELARWYADTLRVPAVILDARTRAEYETSHLHGAERIDPVHPDFGPFRSFPRDTPMVVYSSVGYRGARISYRLGQEGFSRALNLDGGIFQWANEDRPVELAGRPVDRVHPYDARWGLLLRSSSRARVTLPESGKQSAAP
jgi:rhodanese-related sulfurtransferase